jgi:hypothetical protein
LPGITGWTDSIGWDSGGSANTARLSRPEKPEWTRSVTERVKYLRSLRRGWDGYASVPIQEDILSFALSMLDSAMQSETPPPFIAPVSGGGVQIEWHEGGLDIEFYIPQPLRGELYVEYSDGREPLELDLVSDSRPLNEALQEITE